MNIKSILFVLLLKLIEIRGYDISITKCGPSDGVCPNNYCCSKDGYCGTSNDDCNISNGCQISYGLCYQDTDDSTQCGKGKGVCASGHCCSKEGYCGTDDSYCNIANGCQIDYGLCYSEDNDDNDNNETRCGDGVGSCPNNLCCSKLGVCGSTEDHCNVNKGCQLNYGLCYDSPDNDVPEQKCGPSIGICPDNLCCSSDNTCGKTDDHCNLKKGCQIAYGMCYENNDDDNDDTPDNDTPEQNCGPDVGSCPNNLCCSKLGVCGSTEDHCNVNKGCQLNYGLCYDTPDNDDPEQKCGPSIGVCPDNLCCSSDNTCGKTDDHCNLKKGCQIAYGMCYENDDNDDDDDDIIIVDNCGPDYGHCTQNKCCSKDGECGTEDSYCNIKKGCQADYGLCYSPAGSIREGSGKSCGRNNGSCDFPECCSGSGICVLGNDECLVSNGCQISYGLCLSQV